MIREVYRKRNGVWGWEKEDSKAQASDAHFVHNDSMPPLKHPVTGEMIDSVSKWHKVTANNGGRVVGNDLQSAKPNQTQDKVTEKIILDRIEKAEAIASDPARFRERQNENLERLERHRRLIGDSR